MGDKFQKGLKKNRAHNKECLFLATSANKQYLAQKSCLMYNLNKGVQDFFDPNLPFAMLGQTSDIARRCRKYQKTNSLIIFFQALLKCK